MCLQTVFSERKKRAFLKTQPDRIRGWKVLRPSPHSKNLLLEYRHTIPLKDGLNRFNTNLIPIKRTLSAYTGGTHVFKWKKDARLWGNAWHFLVPITVSKKDITTVGKQEYGDENLLILVASKAKFNLSKAERNN